MKSNTDARPLAMPLTARWRVVGWILLTAALMVLALILTVRSIFIRQVDLDANPTRFFCWITPPMMRASGWLQIPSA